MSDLAVIVSSYNRAHLLKEALGSLLRAIPALRVNAAIVVFDAGSVDGSRELVQQVQSRTAIPVRLLGPNAADNSFAAGVNAAVEYAVAHFPATGFLLLYESDNYLESHEPIAAALQFLDAHPEFGAAGFTTRKHSGAPAGFGCPFPKPFHFMLGPRLSHWLRLDRPRLEWRAWDRFRWAPCDVVYTSPILARREAWLQTHGFDARHFPFSDCDLDWAARLQTVGLKQAVIETTHVVHDNGRRPSAWSDARALHFHRARLLWLERHRAVRRNRLIPALVLRHALEWLCAALMLFPPRARRQRVQKCRALLNRAFLGYE